MYVRRNRTRRHVLIGMAAGCLPLLGACGGKEKPAAGSLAQPSAEASPVAMTGEQVFQRCATCHQATGQGVATTYPPLAGSEFATATNPAIPIRVLLHGLQGPITVKGVEFNGIMPQYGTGIEMTDDEIAAVLSFVRSSWGNNASAVTAEMVAKERAATSGRVGPVTAAELKSLM